MLCCCCIFRTRMGVSGRLVVVYSRNKRPDLTGRPLMIVMNHTKTRPRRAFDGDGGLVLNPPTPYEIGKHPPAPKKGCAKSTEQKKYGVELAAKSRKKQRASQATSPPRPGRPARGEVQLSHLQGVVARGRIWPPMMALLLGAIEAPHEAISQLARASEVA